MKQQFRIIHLLQVGIWTQHWPWGRSKKNQNCTLLEPHRNDISIKPGHSKTQKSGLLDPSLSSSSHTQQLKECDISMTKRIFTGVGRFFHINPLSVERRTSWPDCEPERATDGPDSPSTDVRTPPRRYAVHCRNYGWWCDGTNQRWLHR